MRSIAAFVALLLATASLPRMARGDVEDALARHAADDGTEDGDADPDDDDDDGEERPVDDLFDAPSDPVPNPPDFTVYEHHEADGRKLLCMEPDVFSLIDSRLVECDGIEANCSSATIVYRDKPIPWWRYAVSGVILGFAAYGGVEAAGAIW